MTQFLATFFFLSVFTGHWNRIRYQGGTKQKLRKIELALQRYNDATQSVASTQQRIVDLIAKVSAVDTADPTFKPALVELSKSMVEANNQVTTANTALVEAVTSSIPRQSWYVEAMPWPVIMWEDEPKEKP